MKPVLKYRKDYRLSYQVLIYIMLCSAFFTVIGTGTQLYFDYDRDIKRIYEDLRHIEQGYLQPIAGNVWAMDSLQLRKNLQGALQLPDIEYLEVNEFRDSADAIKEKIGKKVSDNIISKTFIFKYGQQEIPLGSLLVVASKDNVLERLKEKVLLILATQALKTFFVSICILVIFYSLIMKRLNLLARYFSAFDINKLDAPLSIQRKREPDYPDEFGRLVNSVNFMRTRLKESIEERNRSQESLKASEERYELAMQFANDGLFDWNVETNEIYYSPGWKRLLGYKDNEIENKFSEWERLTHKDDIKASMEMLNELLEGKRDRFEKEMRMLHKDGHWVDILSRANVTYNEEGKEGRVVGTHIDITERKRSEEALRKSEERFRTVFKAANEVSFIVTDVRDPDPIVLEFSPGSENIFGYSKSEIIGKHVSLFYLPDDAVKFPEAHRQMRESKKGFSGETTLVRKSGEKFPALFSSYPLFDGKGEMYATLEVCFDISEEQKLEAQLYQAQKMESIGRLAGGVAHDFNNMLSLIMGHTEMILDDLEETSPLFPRLEEVRKAAERSTNLTRQLLAFARKQTMELKVLHLNEVLEEMLKMLRRLIGEDIDLSWCPKKDLWPVKLDPSQIDQILANLCVNARDSITGIGKVVIETDNMSIDEDACRDHVGLKAGDYVMIAVSDNGCGMDKKTLKYIFEPFFTTKGVGKGTGLGLATVYGIVKQNNGFIDVYSELDEGTVFKVYLPRYTGKIEEEKKIITTAVAAGHGEVILLVEDEKSILKMMSVMLESLGYTVIASGSPAEAIDITKSYTGEIDLLLSDVVMPEMNGGALAAKLLQSCPDLKCLFMSGYTRDVTVHHGVLDEGVHFIHKPFTKQDLAVKVRQALDEGKGPAQG
ncbi:MAG: PAS domain S-box protein [Deltaproteobacteria bacterium]|nr:PAS domain S-box protein [Deltaproteobacteria bacterium]